MEYITVEEAADKLGVSVATIRRRCASGEVAAVKAGTQWLIDPAFVSSKPPRKRKERSFDESFDLEAAWRHVRNTDLSELWVPDVIALRDLIDGPDEVMKSAEARLSTLQVGPAFRIDIPKTTASNRPGVILDLPDRIAYQAVTESFAGMIEKSLSDRIYSCRLDKDGKYFLQRGPKRWVRFQNAALEHAKKESDGWVASADISSYFEHIIHKILFDELSALGVSGAPLKALRVMLSRWSLVDGVGLPQGPNASRVLGNFYLAQVDHVMLDKGYEYYRYMDDIRIVAKEKSEAMAAIRDFEDLCRRRGLICSSAKTEVVSANEYITRDENASRNLADYFFESNNLDRARPELKKILKRALAKERVVQRDAKFSIWRLARIRENTCLNQILKRIEDLAPLASPVAAYLKYFVNRESAQRKISEFMSDPARSYSKYLRTWILAAMLESKRIPGSWNALAKRDAMDKNNPNYLRAIALCVMAKGRNMADVNWIRSELDIEHDPVVLRAHLVALKYANALDKSVLRTAAARLPALEGVGNWLLSRRSLPSLLYRDQEIAI